MGSSFSSAGQNHLCHLLTGRLMFPCQLCHIFIFRFPVDDAKAFRLFDSHLAPGGLYPLCTGVRKYFAHRRARSRWSSSEPEYDRQILPPDPADTERSVRVPGVLSSSYRELCIHPEPPVPADGSRQRTALPASYHRYCTPAL